MDPSLADRIIQLALVRGHLSAQALEQARADSAAGEAGTDAAFPARLAGWERYRVVRQLGRGGMG